MAGLLATPLIGSVAGVGAAGPALTSGLLGSWGMVDSSVSVGQALTGLGALTSAAGSISAGNAQASAARYNAEVEQIQAGEQQSQASAQAALQAQQNKRNMGAVAAAYGAAGVDPTQGSPLEVMQDQAAQGELARQFDLYRGQVASTNALNQVALDQAEAPLYQSRG